MKSALIASVLLLSSSVLFAQSDAKPQSQTLELRVQPMANDCPVSMRANQGVWDHTIRVRQGQQEKVIQPFGQRIFLTLSGAHPAPIIAATVKVYGLTAKNHMVQTDSNANADGVAARTIKITFTPSSNGGVTGELYIPGFTAVNSIELLDVSYQDGRIWRVGGSSGCRVVPDPVMLIANH